MLRRIFKYQVSPFEQSQVSLPKGCKILSADFRHNSIFLWAEIDSENQNRFEPLKVCVIPTGHVVPDDAGNFVDTIHDEQSMSTFHVYVSPYSPQ